MSDYTESSEFIDPSTGRPRTFESRKRYRAEQDRAKQLARATAAHAARKNAPAKSGYEDDIAAMKSQLKKSFSRKEKQQIKRRLVQYEEAHEKWEDSQIVAKFEKDFDRSDLAVLARDSVDAIRRSGSVIFPNATPEELDELVSLWDVRHEFGDAGAFGREYFATLSQLEEKEAEASSKFAEDTRIESERLAAESANAQLKAAQAKQRSEAARGAIDE